MISILLAFALCQAPPVPVPAGAAKAAITDPRTGKAYPAKIKARAVHLSAKTATRGQGNIVRWIVLPRKYLIDHGKSDDGTLLWLTIGDEEATLQIFQIVAKGDQSDTQEVNIIVNEGGPKPPPGPDPTPIPVPPPVTDFLGFAAMAKTEAAKLPAANRRQAAILADNFDAIGGRLAAGGLKTPEAANKELKAMNLETMGGDRLTWLPWFQAWQKIADKGNNDGTLATNEHYVNAYQATAAGLRGVN